MGDSKIQHGVTNSVVVVEPVEIANTVLVSCGA